MRSVGLVLTLLFFTACTHSTSTTTIRRSAKTNTSLQQTMESSPQASQGAAQASQDASQAIHHQPPPMSTP